MSCRVRSTGGRIVWCILFDRFVRIVYDATDYRLVMDFRTGHNHKSILGLHQQWVRHERSEVEPTMSDSNKPFLLRWGIISTGVIASRFVSVSVRMPSWCCSRSLNHGRCRIF